MPTIQKILVVCSTAMATSTLIARTIEEAMTVRGLPVVTHQCKVNELSTLASQGYALVVATTIIRERLPIPVINAMSFLCGSDYQQALNDIANVLAKT